jgi:hypothetical protein
MLLSTAREDHAMAKEIINVSPISEALAIGRIPL